MQIDVPAMELQVGDVWNGKKIVAISPPLLGDDGTLWIYFEGLSYPTPFDCRAVFLVERTVKNVLIG